MTIQINSVADLDDAAKTFLSITAGKKVFAFYGAMGAGKTTFIKALCNAIGVEDNVTSPTFAIINEYSTSDGAKVFHFDFYRIQRIDEAVDIGCEEYFYSGSTCFIEWPEIIESLLPSDTLRVEIKVADDGSRALSF